MPRSELSILHDTRYIPVELQIGDPTNEASSRFKCWPDNSCDNTASLYRRKLKRTALLCWSFFALGWSASLSGTSFPDLQLIIREDLSTASWIFTAASFGALSGALIGGFLYQKWNKLILLAAATLGQGIATLITPYCPSLPSMMVIKFVAFFFGGMLDSGGNADIPHIWGSQNGRYMQAVHFGFSIGALTSPVATAPFLSNVVQDCSNKIRLFQENIHKKDTLVTQLFISNTSTSAVASLSSSKPIDNALYSNISNVDACADPCENTDIRYAFLISAILTLSASVGFMYIYLRMKFDDLTKNNPVTDLIVEPATASVPKPLTLPWKVLFLTLLASLITAESVVEESFPNFFMKFGISYLKWNVSKNVIALTLFWVSFGVGRFCGIFIVLCCKNNRMLTIFLLLLGTAFSTFLVGTYTVLEPLVFCSVAAIGFSMSVVFPAVLSWTSEEVLPVTGRVSGLFMTSASLGGMVFPPLIGSLMESMHPMWFVYILTTTTGTALTMFLAIQFLLKVRKRSTKLPKYEIDSKNVLKRT